MSRVTYTLEPQRLLPGRGYVACEPHQACRVVIKQITSVPPKAGRKRHRIERIHATFHGSGMMLSARATLDSLTARTAPRPKVRKPWGRSLTLAEYNEVMSRSK